MTKQKMRFSMDAILQQHQDQQQKTEFRQQTNKKFQNEFQQIEQKNYFDFSRSLPTNLLPSSSTNDSNTKIVTSKKHDNNKKIVNNNTNNIAQKNNNQSISDLGMFNKKISCSNFLKSENNEIQSSICELESEQKATTSSVYKELTINLSDDIAKNNNNKSYSIAGKKRLAQSPYFLDETLTEKNSNNTTLISNFFTNFFQMARCPTASNDVTSNFFNNNDMVINKTTTFTNHLRPFQLNFFDSNTVNKKDKDNNDGDKTLPIQNCLKIAPLDNNKYDNDDAKLVNVPPYYHKHNFLPIQHHEKNNILLLSKRQQQNQIKTNFSDLDDYEDDEDGILEQNYSDDDEYVDDGDSNK